LTLVEILISSALISVILGSVYLVYLTMQDTFSKGELKADLQQSARVGLAKMTQEIRMAGYDPKGTIPLVVTPPKGSIRAAMPACLSFLADVEGKGNTVQITYHLDATTLRREEQPWKTSPKEFDGGGGAQPLAGSVMVLAFTYYDDANQILVPQKRQSTMACPPDPAAALIEREVLTFDEMRRIRRVAITLKTQGERPGVVSESFTLTSDVHLRNL
jgi:hypothetical protein